MEEVLRTYKYVLRVLTYISWTLWVALYHTVWAYTRTREVNLSLRVVVLLNINYVMPVTVERCTFIHGNDKYTYRVTWGATTLVKVVTSYMSGHYIGCIKPWTRYIQNRPVAIKRYGICVVFCIYRGIRKLLWKVQYIHNGIPLVFLTCCVNPPGVSTYTFP